MTRFAHVVPFLGLFWCSAALGQPAIDQPAAPTPLLFFHSALKDDLAVAELRRELQELIAARGGGFVDLTPAAPGPSRIEEHANQGETAFHAFQYDAAQRALRAAVNEAARTGGADVGPTRLADLHLLLALTSIQRGDTVGAWDEFVAAARIDPTRILDAARYSPSVVAAYRRASTAVLQGEYSLVKVDVPSDCQVWLDGRLTPAQDAHNLARGHHYLAIACPGSSPYGARVLVQHERQRIKPAIRPMALPDDRHLSRLASQRGADLVIVVQVLASPGAPATLLLRCLDGRAQRARSRVTIGMHQDHTAEQLRAAVARLLDGQHIDGPPPTREFSPARGKRPWYQRPWVWASIGAVATALTLSPFLFDQGPSRGFVVRPRGDLSIWSGEL